MSKEIFIPVTDNLTRDLKGFNFEKQVQNGLRHAKIPYFKANDTSTFEAWQKNKGKGADIQLPDAEVECKFLTKRVYKSYIDRDWIPRFNFTKKYKIYVTNNKWRIPQNLRIYIYKKGIRIMDLFEFLWWCIKHYSSKKYKLWLKANKLKMTLFKRHCLNNLVLFVKGLKVTYLNDFG